MPLLRLFTAHPAAVGESYVRHLCQAAIFGARLVVAGCACMVHAILPFLFVHTGSRTVAELNERLVPRRGAVRGGP
jgi:hypothetical protein